MKRRSCRRHSSLNLRPFAIVAVAAVAMGGCASQVSQTREGRGPDASGRIAVVFAPAFARDTSPSFGREVAGCVGRAIDRAFPGRLLPTAELQRTVFPDLTSDATPLSPESLAVLLADDTFRDRLTTAGLRHLVVVGGGTYQPVASGGGGCGGGYGGGGCFGFWLWKRESTLWASVIDLADGQTVGKVEVKVTGRPWFAMILIFPLGLPSFTETWGCMKVGSAVVRLLRPAAETP